MQYPFEHPLPRARHRVKTDRVVCFGFTLHSHHIIPTPTPYHLYTCAVPGSYLRRCTLGFRGKIRGCSGAGTTLVRRRYEVDPSFTLCCTGFIGECEFADCWQIWRIGKDDLPLPYRPVGMFFGLRHKWRGVAWRSSLYSGRIASAEQGGCIGGMLKGCRPSSDVVRCVVSVGFVPYVKV